MKTPRYAALIRRLKAGDDVETGAVRHLPDWVTSCRLRTERRATWIYIEPRLPAADEESGQLVIDLPAGRYMIEIMDLETEQWISRESAAGGPLVAGLPCTGHALLVRIARIGDTTPAG